MLLDAEPDFEVAGEAANGNQALAQARRLDLDVLLMDVRMPELDGIEATRRSGQAPPASCSKTQAVSNSPPPCARSQQAKRSWLRPSPGA
jgi:DNA-binding NarL/FixJ family response regulator